MDPDVEKYDVVNRTSYTPQKRIEVKQERVEEAVEQPSSSKKARYSMF